MNLVGPGPLEPHYLDCALAIEGLEPQGRWADMGSGAGFPGVIFAATFPEVQVELVDSRKKRCVFLQTVLDEAGAPEGVRVVRARLEELPEARYDGVMARALAPWPKVLRHARRLLCPGGQVLLLTGAQDVPEADDFQVQRSRTYTVASSVHRVTLLRLAS